MPNGMKAKLRQRLDYLNPDIRERVIDDTLAALSVPTPFMVASGAAVLRWPISGGTHQAIVERVFAEMLRDAQEGG